MIINKNNKAFSRDVFVLLIIVLVSSCKKEEESDGIRIHGKVTDNSTGAPIYEAYVGIKTNTGMYSTMFYTEVYTKSDGSYQLTISKSEISSPILLCGSGNHKTITQNVDAGIPDQVINMGLDSL